jgi:hypothetical protein
MARTTSTLLGLLQATLQVLCYRVFVIKEGSESEVQGEELGGVENKNGCSRVLSY